MPAASPKNPGCSQNRARTTKAFVLALNIFLFYLHAVLKREPILRDSLAAIGICGRRRANQDAVVLDGVAFFGDDLDGIAILLDAVFGIGVGDFRGNRGGVRVGGGCSGLTWLERRGPALFDLRAFAVLEGVADGLLHTRAVGILRRGGLYLQTVVFDRLTLAVYGDVLSVFLLDDRIILIGPSRRDGRNSLLGEYRN